MNRELIQIINIIFYRLEKSLKATSQDYFEFQMENESRSPSAILSHLVDVSNYGLSIIGAPKSLKKGVEALEMVNDNFEIMKSYLSENELEWELGKQLINGPLSDTLTHIGQLAFLRRLHGNPIENENYTKADI